MKFNERELEEGAKEIASYINGGFDQFEPLSKNIPFSENVTEAFGSLYMLTRDILTEVLYEDAKISDLHMFKLQKEWEKAEQVIQLAELVNDEDLIDRWKAVVYSSYGQILTLIHVIQKSYIRNDV